MFGDICSRLCMDGRTSYYLRSVFCSQKTAYELRISDWSSGVCSSDRPPVERLALDRPDQAELETRPHYRIADVENERANRSRWRQLRPLLRTIVGNVE